MTELLEKASQTLTNNQQNAIAEWILSGGLEQLRQLRNIPEFQKLDETVKRIDSTMERIRQIKESTK